MRSCVLVYTRGVEQILRQAALLALGSCLRLEILKVIEISEDDIPTEFYDPIRGQFLAEGISYMLLHYKQGADIVVGVLDVDAYVPGLNFVFGLAVPSMGVASVYTPRLRMYAQGLEHVAERVLKEVLHEVGHVFGLDHCSNRLCVMSFSNSVFEVDIKRAAYCKRCYESLKRGYGVEVSEWCRMEGIGNAL